MWDIIIGMSDGVEVGLVGFSKGVGGKTLGGHVAYPRSSGGTALGTLPVTTIVD